VIYARKQHMLIWCVILFLLGISAFMDGVFNYGQLFRSINSVMFMLVSLAVLIRTAKKIKAARVEGYLEKIACLKKQLRELQQETYNHNILGNYLI
jgi:uncharacterized membrane protein